MTTSYVVVATSFAVLLVGVLGVAGMFVYAYEINRQIAVMQRAANEFSERAAERGDGFPSAVLDFEQSVRREGIHTYAFQPEPGPPGGAALLARGDEIAYVDGTERRGSRGRFLGNRFGLAVAALFGVRFIPPQRFLDGLIGFSVDADSFQTIALAILGAVAGAGLLSAGLAAAFGRYVAAQTIRPLVEVTEALQRFAARDFRAQPIAVGGRSDFDVLALAYNAASAQVAAAFAERDAAEHQMRQFVADAGHELRTPLTIVLGYIDLLRKRVTPDERSQASFAAIASEGKRMRTLVDNLVLLARLEGDDTRPVEPFEIGALLREIVDLRRGLDASVRFEFDATVEAAAIGRRDELHEAFGNIVDNAIKYAPDSPIRISVTSTRPGAVDVRIADDGPGIPAADRAAIFERFFRGSERGDVEGSGLGLAIAKRAVERSGGTLRLDAGVERGTAFVATLRADRVRPLVPANE